ncbi:hypothetical protein K438DRAFT_1816254 [Mycena galopus ATCC 62051]|nr:hypothetical protein K438DRAFT_1816254 [Mycena galopus ATCC 62051]
MASDSSPKQEIKNEEIDALKAVGTTLNSEAQTEPAFDDAVPMSDTKSKETSVDNEWIGGPPKPPGDQARGKTSNTTASSKPSRPAPR